MSMKQPKLSMWQWIKIYRGRKKMFLKLKSRKLWAAVLATVLVTLGTQLGLDEGIVAKVVEIAMFYILGQAAVDVAAAVKTGKK